MRSFPMFPDDTSERPSTVGQTFVRRRIVAPLDLDLEEVQCKLTSNVVAGETWRCDMIWRSVALLALALTLGATPASAVMTSSPPGIDGRLRFEWEASQSRRGRPVIAGYLYNDNGRAAKNVILLVETLDASGQVVERTVGFVPSLVPVFDRTYFEVPLKAAGASHRISVTLFQWDRGGS
jgi:hypothetical protein